MDHQIDSRALECADFEPVPVRRRVDGWTAERQRTFIRVLSETGCVSQAAAEVGLTPRSAFRLAARPDAQGFARAWAWAQTIAATRLTSRAFEYAVHGMRETVWKGGVCVAERRRPSEKLLIYLLTHLDPTRFGKAALAPGFRDFREVASETVSEFLEEATDVPASACRVETVSFADWEDDGTAPPA